MRLLYTRADVERLVGRWDQGVTLEDADARVDFTRARASLAEQNRLALHYLCAGYEAPGIAKLMQLSTPTVRKLLADTLTRMTEKMNRGAGTGAGTGAGGER